MGSPPLTRERLENVRKHNPAQRITPAYAGKTNQDLFTGWGYWDHPRLRGKDYAGIILVVAVIGSPPLTRERHIGTLVNDNSPGITPAYAGKTVKDPFILATLAEFKCQISLTFEQVSL